MICGDCCYQENPAVFVFGKEDSYERNPSGVSFVCNRVFSELYKVLKKRTQLVKKIDKLTITADRTICGDCCFIPEASQSSRPAGREEDSICFSRRRVRREKHFARRECVPLGQGPGGTHGVERESPCSKRTAFFWNKIITADRMICGDFFQAPRVLGPAEKIGF